MQVTVDILYPTLPLLLLPIRLFGTAGVEIAIDLTTDLAVLLPEKAHPGPLYRLSVFTAVFFYFFIFFFFSIITLAFTT
jgi:hypothetical protein